jgi:hypothetical protein
MTQQRNHNLSTFKSGKPKLVLAALAFVVVILAASSWCAVRRSDLYRIDFQEYAPTYLPDGLAIRQTTVEAGSPIGQNSVTTTSLRLGMAQQSLIYERKAEEAFAYVCRAKVTNQRCVTRSTTAGQRYEIITSNVLRQPIEQDVEWVKGTTWIRVVMVGEPGQPYPPETLDRIVDSFQPALYSHVLQVRVDRRGT